MAGRPARGGNGHRRWRDRLRELLRQCRQIRIRPDRVLLGFLCVIGYTLLISANVFRPAIPWQVGDRATRDVYADESVQALDEEATAARRDAAMAQVPKKYGQLPVADEAIERINRVFDDLNANAEEWQERRAVEGEPPPDAPLPRLSDNIDLDLDPALMRYLLELPAASRERLRAQALYHVGRIYATIEIRTDQAEDLRSATAAMENSIAEHIPRRYDREFLQALCTDDEILKPNRMYKEFETMRERLKAAEDVQPVMRTIHKDDLVIQRDMRVTEEHRRVFEALGLLQPQLNYASLFAMGCLVCVVLVVLGVYLRWELPEIYHDNRRLLLLNLIAAGALLLFRFMIWLKGEVPSLAHAAILCGSASGMMVSVLIDFRLAMMMTGLMGLFMGVLLPGAGLWVAFEAWLAGRVGAVVLRQARDRGDLARAGFKIAFSGMMIAAVVNLPSAGAAGAYGAPQLGTDFLFGFGWSLLAFLLAQGLIPVLEKTFGCLTPFRLLELTNTSTPVLEELKRRARGTFEASLIIGDMASDACESIEGADPLLARVCGYYHDIGKMVHPGWFIENQFGAENIHDRIPPAVSAKAIRSHVDEGVRIAEQNGLPQPVVDVIREHHGTMLVSFFYYQALETCPEGQTVDESAFRYRGPRPRSKESGVIMLADGIEAAVRAVSTHGPLTERRIAEIVDSTIEKRLEERQLDECALTMRDIHLAAQSFREFLRGMYHSRIEYPQQALGRRRDERGRGNGSEAVGSGR